MKKILQKEKLKIISVRAMDADIPVKYSEVKLNIVRRSRSLLRFNPGKQGLCSNQQSMHKLKLNTEESMLLNCGVGKDS